WAMCCCSVAVSIIAQAKAEQDATVVSASAFDPQAVAQGAPAPFAQEQTPADPNMRAAAPVTSNTLPSESETFVGAPAAMGGEATLASGVAEFDPAAPFADSPTGEHALPAYTGDDLSSRVDTDSVEPPVEFHKARTQVRPLSEITAAMELAGEPTGEGMSRADTAGLDEPLSEQLSLDGADPFGSLDAPFGAPTEDRFDTAGADEFPVEELGPPPGGDYHDAPPGEQTRVFMATAGIFKRRRNNMISAVVGTLLVLALGGIITLDVLGIYTIPGMGLAYDLTGFEDPNKERAIERTKAKLQTAGSDEERKRLQQKLLGLGGDSTPAKKGKGGGKSTAKAKSDGEVTEGIKDETDLSDEKRSLAGSLFEDDRKTGSTPKLKAPEQITTADLPDGLTQEAIQKVIAEKQSSMKLCLTEAYRKGEKLSGRMEVQITIDATGKVTEAAINTDKYKSSSMGQCTVKRVQTWKFPRFNGDPVTVVFPYVLTLGL
ncbi:MAG: AgmX/PglI C-terminal domain-containing protein, partial [Myxococcota bacterium]